MISPEQYKKCLEYIEKHWKVLTHSFPHDQKIQIGLPRPFVSPSTDIFANDQFYWDTYFTILGLVVAARAELARGMVDNLTHLFKRFGIVPMRNRFFNTGISQPPFLTSMVKEVSAVLPDEEWRRASMIISEEE